MKKQIYRIANAIGEFILLGVLALLPVSVVYIDTVFRGRGVASEFSVTQMTQQTLLLIIALIFWYGAWQHAKSRGFLMLVAGFFSCALIREMDGLMDAIWQGFWLLPALIVAFATVAYVIFCCRDSVIDPMSNFTGTKSCFCIMIGLVVLLVFSRTFGSGNLLWKDLMGERYMIKFKNALQEGLELLGYLFIAYGAFMFFLKRFYAEESDGPVKHRYT